jgi:hypothetical protein
MDLGVDVMDGTVERIRAFCAAWKGKYSDNWIRTAGVNELTCTDVLTACDEVLRLAAERDDAVAASQKLAAENARLADREAWASLIAQHVKGNCPLCKGSGRHHDLFALYRVQMTEVLVKHLDGTATVDCPWCKSARAFLAGEGGK